MYIYQLQKLNESGSGNSYGINTISCEIMHNVLYTEKQFNELCNKALEQIGNKNIYTLKGYLIRHYGFKMCSISERFQFESN